MSIINGVKDSNHNKERIGLRQWDKILNKYLTLVKVNKIVHTVRFWKHGYHKIDVIIS